MYIQCRPYDINMDGWIHTKWIHLEELFDWFDRLGGEFKLPVHVGV